MKLISIDNGEHFHKTSNDIGKAAVAPSDSLPASQPPSVPPPAIPTSRNGSSSVIVNHNNHIDGSSEKKPPPIPSRAPTTSLTNRPTAVRQSVTGVYGMKNVY